MDSESSQRAQTWYPFAQLLQEQKLEHFENEKNLILNQGQLTFYNLELEIKIMDTVKAVE